MRKEFLPFALPDIDRTEIDQVSETIRSLWITTGRKAGEFEESFAEAVGAKFAVAVNSCTAAMHLALEAAGLKKGDEVITSPYTFAATAEVIRYFDAKPVFADIRAGDFNLDPECVGKALTPKTRAVIPVHIAGLAVDMDPILDMAGKNGLVVIEDAAHAFPASYKNRTIGSIGDATCFSFYATKTLTTGEGGMITTNRQDWADRYRVMSLHGISKDAWKRYTAEGSWYYEIIAPGFKYNMTDVAAAMGLAQLKKADKMKKRRHEIAIRYTEAFRDMEELEVPSDGIAGSHAWHLYMLRLNLSALSIDRAGFADALKDRRIGISVHFIPLHLHPYYRETYGYAPDDFPVAYREYMREISLPVYSKMSDQDVEDVIDSVKEIVRKAVR